MLFELISVTSPIFIITAIGYLWVITDQPFDAETITLLVLRIGTPCLVFSSLTSLDLDLTQFWQMAVSAALAVAIAGALGIVCLAALRLPANAFLPLLMLPNSGNIGLPVVLLTFGERGLALGVSYFFMIALMQFTLGPAITAGELHVRHLINQPLIYAVALVLIVFSTGIRVPVMVAETTRMLGSIVIPSMLLLLGTALARLKVVDLRRAAALSVTRLVIGAVVGLIVVNIVGLTGTSAGVAFLMAVMPSAVVNHIFAQRYAARPADVAGTIVTSTILTILLLPVLVWLALQLAQTELLAAP